MAKRKICVVTGGRAEYGLLRGLMKEIQKDPTLELQVVATGMHLSADFGLTFKMIESDGFFINCKVPTLNFDDSPVGIARAIGLGTSGFADAIENLKPDLIVVLGDRYEILAAVQAALVARIPVAHIHGGELTFGAIDDSMRHAITKMSHLHYVAAEPYRKRVIQLGEHPDRVLNFGAPGLDSAARMEVLSKDEFESRVGIKLGACSFLVTYHPETLGTLAPESAVRELLSALDEFPEAKIILTQANADSGGRAINRVLEEYVAANPGRALVVAALGQLLYFNAIRHTSVVIGNSSSGIIEVPFFRKPTVNIGQRQGGRLRAKSVLDCGEGRKEISAAIRQALSAAFQEEIKSVDSPYGQGDTAVRIKESLAAIDLGRLTLKEFHDV